MAEKPKEPDAKPKRCFVICPIGEEGSETRQRTADVFEFIIEPVAQSCGYTVVERADQLSKPGTITHQIIDLLLSYELVVADLTGPNPNVMYELAVRHAIHRPVVQIMSLGDRLPFDIASSRTIFFDWHSLRSADHCREELEKQIKVVERDPMLVDNPITDSINIGNARRSGDQTEKLLVQVIDTINGLGQRISDVERTALTRSVFNNPYGYETPSDVTVNSRTLNRLLRARQAPMPATHVYADTTGMRAETPPPLQAEAGI